MAERVILVELKADATGLVKGLDESSQEAIELKEQIASIEDELRNLSKEAAKGEAAKAFDKLNRIVENNVLSIQELGAAADNYKNIALAAGVSSPIGQEALKKAADMERQMNKVNQTVAQLEEGGRALNTTMQLGTSVIAGWSAFQGVTALLGKENEDLQKTFVKLQAAQAALMGVKELSIALDRKGLIVTTAQATANKALAFTQNLYTIAVGNSTGAMKIFRLALISTGIGALVVGLGLLIANFDLVKKKTIEFVDWLSNLSDVILILLGPIGLLVLAYKHLFKEVETEATAAEKKLREQMEAENARHKKRLEQIEKEKNARIEASDDTIKEMKRQIEINQNLGKSYEEETIRMLEAEAEKVRAVRDSNLQMLQAHIEHYTNIAKLRGQSEEEFIKSMAAQGLFLEDYLQRANEIIAENEANVELSESRITKFKREQNEKRGKEADEARKKELEEQKKLLDAQLALEAELTNLLLQNMEDGAEKELAILMDKHGRERDALIAKYGENKELLEQLEIKQERELEALYKKFQDARQKKEQEYVDQLIEIRLSNLADGKDKELELLKRKHEQELQAIREKYGEQTELEKELLIRQKNELSEVEKKYDDQAQQERIAKAEATLEQINQYLDLANQVNDVLNEIGDRRKEKIQKQADEQLSVIDQQKAKELSREGLTADQKANIEKKFAIQKYQTQLAAAKAQDEIARRQFQREKALKLAQIAIDTAGGVVKAVAASPVTFGLPWSAFVAALGIAQGALVATQKFEGSAGSIQPPDFSSAGASSSGGGGNSSNGQGQGGQNDTTTLTDSLLGGGKPKPPPIIISQVEINKQQDEMAQIDNVSTIGG